MIIIIISKIVESVQEENFRQFLFQLEFFKQLCCAWNSYYELLNKNIYYNWLYYYYITIFIIITWMSQKFCHILVSVTFWCIHHFVTYWHSTELSIKRCTCVNKQNRCPWCNGYCRRIWTRWHEFKYWTRLIAFHIALIPLRKEWIQLFSLQLWVNSRAD